MSHPGQGSSEESPKNQVFVPRFASTFAHVCVSLSVKPPPPSSASDRCISINFTLRGAERARTTPRRRRIFCSRGNTQTNYTFGGREKREYACLQANLSHEQNWSEKIWCTGATLHRGGVHWVKGSVHTLF